MGLIICGVITSIIGLLIFDDALYMSYVIGATIGGVMCMIGLSIDGNMRRK